MVTKRSFSYNNLGFKRAIRLLAFVRSYPIEAAKITIYQCLDRKPFSS